MGTIPWLQPGGLSPKTPRMTPAPARLPALRRALQDLHAGRFAEAATASAPWANPADLEADLIHALASAAAGSLAAAPALARIARRRPASQPPRAGPARPPPRRRPPRRRRPPPPRRHHRNARRSPPPRPARRLPGRDRRHAGRHRRLPPRHRPETQRRRLVKPGQGPGRRGPLSRIRHGLRPGPRPRPRGRPACPEPRRRPPEIRPTGRGLGSPGIPLPPARPPQSPCPARARPPSKRYPAVRSCSARKKGSATPCR